tara:strand:- start:417 stop:542 length:126 start_codon:yes stop_codon:yes gene_type:complete
MDSGDGYWYAREVEEARDHNPSDDNLSDCSGLSNPMAGSDA